MAVSSFVTAMLVFKIFAMFILNKTNMTITAIKLGGWINICVLILVVIVNTMFEN